MGNRKYQGELGGCRSRQWKGKVNFNNATGPGNAANRSAGSQRTGRRLCVIAFRDDEKQLEKFMPLIIDQLDSSANPLLSHQAVGWVKQ